MNLGIYCRGMPHGVKCSDPAPLPMLPLYSEAVGISENHGERKRHITSRRVHLDQCCATPVYLPQGSECCSYMRRNRDLPLVCACEFVNLHGMLQHADHAFAFFLEGAGILRPSSPSRHWLIRQILAKLWHHASCRLAVNLTVANNKIGTTHFYRLGHPFEACHARVFIPLHNDIALVFAIAMHGLMGLLYYSNDTFQLHLQGIGGQKSDAIRLVCMRVHN
jgi:hypothetical protein